MDTVTPDSIELHQKQRDAIQIVEMIAALDPAHYDIHMTINFAVIRKNAPAGSAGRMLSSPVINGELQEAVKKDLGYLLFRVEESLHKKIGTKMEIPGFLKKIHNSLKVWRIK